MPNQNLNRPHRACLNCRRKKTRCPGERPSCSTCTRLNQRCLYTSRESSLSQPTPVEERLAHVEAQLNRLLGQERNADDFEHYSGDNVQTTSVSSSRTACGSNIPGVLTSLSNQAKALDLYFENCHGQPIWCIDRKNTDDVVSLSNELAQSLLALTCRFAQELGTIQSNLDCAQKSIMLSVAHCPIGLSTVQSLCLLAYSFFLDEQFSLGQFYTGLGSQLCRSALLDRESTYTSGDAASDLKRKIFWSFQVLEQMYGSQAGILQVPTHTWEVCFSTSPNTSLELSESTPAQVSTLDVFSKHGNASDAWGHMVHLGWIWSMVRKYVSDAMLNRISEPWRYDSQYMRVLSDLMQLESRVPMCHRYQCVKFYQRQPQELQDNRDYWGPWLRLQFTYHTIHVVLNHPFIYTSIMQHRQDFSVSNSFWRKSMEQVLLHATWVVRLVEMACEKQARFFDPFFAHATAIAATVHLFYCGAANQSLRLKSRENLMRCMSFLKEFTPYSTLCESLESKLVHVVQVAAGPDSANLEQWVPLRIRLSTELMWDILGLSFATSPSSVQVPGFFDDSMQPPTTLPSEQPSSIFEIAAATSPDITLQDSDGGQAAPVPSTSIYPISREDEAFDRQNNTVVIQNETLGDNPSWLWQHHSQVSGQQNVARQHLHESAIGDGWDAPWWEFGRF